MWMDRQMDVGHINLIGELVTCNPPNKIFATSGPLAAHHGSCTTYVVVGPLMDHLWQIYKQAIYKVIKWRKD